jgi:hypothetical protein
MVHAGHAKQPTNRGFASEVRLIHPNLVDDSMPHGRAETSTVLVYDKRRADCVLEGRKAAYMPFRKARL